MPEPRPGGKQIAGRLYLHLSQVPGAVVAGVADPAAAVTAAAALAGVADGQFNLVRFGGGAGPEGEGDAGIAGPVLALLHYPDLFCEAFPALRESWLVDLTAGTVRYRTWADSRNPPILHRQELLLPADDRRRAGFAALTAGCEAVGLFDDPRRIGYQRQWQALIRDRGYRLVGLELVPLGNEEGNEDGDEAGADPADSVPAHADQADLAPADRAAAAGAPTPAGWQAARHLTALTRYGLSAPMQALARHGLLDGRYRLFDYGCGRGDDLRALAELGIEAAGWDPYYAPDQPIGSADLVNLGFVINVIEDFDERVAALTRAWSLAGRLLVVAVMLANQNAVPGAGFNDGVLTRRGTFQRYYTQGEIKAWLEQVLEETVLPVAPGVLFVCRDKDLEQRILAGRWRSRQRLPLALAGTLPRPRPVPRPLSPPLSAQIARDRPARPDAATRAAARYETWRVPLERLWATWCDLGRPPAVDDVGADLPALLAGFGSLGKALRFLADRQDSAALATAAAARTADLTVYLALEQLARRRAYRHLEPGLKRDLKHFFGSPAAAVETARALLYRIADTGALAEAAREAATRGLGWLEVAPSAPPSAPPAGLAPRTPAAPMAGVAPSAPTATLAGLAPRAPEAPMAGLAPSAPTAGLASRGSDLAGVAQPRTLQLHVSLVDRLPALLRVYIGAAAALYGDYRNADLLKVHLGTGKLTLMRFDDFDGAPLPRMLERVKIKLREQDIEYYGYGEDWPPPFLYHKSRYINEEHPNYPEQRAFDDALDDLAACGLLDLSGYGPTAADLLAALARQRLAIDGCALVPARDLPDLDTPCGRWLTWRQLIECGETQVATGLPNRPLRPESYNALHALVTAVLDPVIDWFGMPRLTYGFCGPDLARRIPGRIAPRLDQHAACEHNRRGEPICPRLGAAVDFIIDDEDMAGVARWVAAHTAFDRLYFYGPDLPIHVSHGPEHGRQVVWMKPARDGRRVPRVCSAAELGTG